MDLSLEKLVVELAKNGLEGHQELVRGAIIRALKGHRMASDAPAMDETLREQLTRILVEAEAHGRLRGGAQPGAVARARHRERTGAVPRPSETPSADADSGSQTGDVREWQSDVAEDALMDARSSLPLLHADDGRDAREPRLTRETRSAIDALISEHTQRAALAAAGLEPTRSVLFVGAPGVGKTMSSRYLAKSLGLPLYTINLAGVVSSYLGRTGQNLQRALEFTRARSCVVLLDEFDALAKRRDDQSDVGELKRIVNVLLLELERWPSTSLLIAATNHPELLDRAIWRRFERVVSFPLPDTETRRTIIEELLAASSQTVVPDRVSRFVALTEEASGSELSRIVRGSIRDLVVKPAEDQRDLADFLDEHALGRLRRAALVNETARETLVRALRRIYAMSYRNIAEEAGMSHMAVKRLLERKTKAVS